MMCDFEKLGRYLDRKLGGDERLDLLKHLDNCEICFEVLFILQRDRDAGFYLHPRARRQRSGDDAACFYLAV